MAFADKVENLYLKIWRTLVLCVATTALIAAVAASAFAINGLFVAAPYPPVEINAEDRGAALQQALSIENFRNSEARVQGRQPAKHGNPKREDAAGAAINDALRKISMNLDNYVKTAFPKDSPIREATEWNVKHTMKELKLNNDGKLKLYLSTLEALSADLAKLGGEQAVLPEDRRINSHDVLRWHAETVQQTFQAVDRENEKLQKVYQQQLVDHANRHTRIMSYIGVAAGAVTIFVFTILLFVIIRIERDLRMMAIASMATAKQLEGSGPSA